MTTSTPLLQIMIASLALWAAGCPPTAPQPVTGDVTFPHAADFAEPAVHGPQWFVTTEACAVCHVEPPAGTHVQACIECHERFPHAEGYAEPAAHGPDGAGGGGECTTCHGSGDRRPAGRDQSACRDCHRDYPHRVTWELPQIHGQPVLDEGIAVCGTCHGADYTGGATAGACGECHELYPHPDGFEEIEGHGPVALESDNTSCATSCHGTDFGGGGTGIACADCHELFPHATGYRGTAHRDAVEQYGEAECLKCHVDGAGFPADFSCAETCHGG